MTLLVIVLRRLLQKSPAAMANAALVARIVVVLVQRAVLPDIVDGVAVVDMAGRGAAVAQRRRLGGKRKVVANCWFHS